MPAVLESSPMRVAFAGTPEFAAYALVAIIGAGHAVPLVLTQPDRPSGRGMKLTRSAVKEVALAHGLALDQPAGLKTDAARAPLAAAAADVLVVAAYGLILPQAILDLPRFGCLNIHASLLPRWRGAAPIQRAIAAGDRETGITIMQMDAGLDTGPMLMKRALAIDPDDSAGALHDKLAALGAESIVAALARLEAGDLPPTAQPQQGVTYAAKLDKAEAELDLRLPAEALERQIRAFDPFPVALLRHGDATVKVWRATVVPGGGAPGEVLASGPSGIVVASGDRSLCLQQLQRAGGKRLSARDFLAGFAVPVGSRFELRHV
jgi:methionyl-tRNA formyltransferase